MITLPNYQLTAKIYESDDSLVYRGIQTEDNCPVILKVLRKDYPTPAELTRYRQEYKLTSQLKLEGVVKAYSWEKYKNTPIIIFEDFGGVSLKILMGETKFTLLQFLEIAIKIVQSIDAIHTYRIIHKDINPANIVLNPDTKQIKLIDFGISTLLNKEETKLRNPQVLEGTLAYMSPEQTGRMNRYLDYRTDFYSLGVTLYELLTSQLPFQTEDALELVHFHLAKQPIPPHEFNPDIPQILSQIIIKLLAKNAENRYQSSWGILADLELCWHQLEQTGKIEVFCLGEGDISDKLQIPQKLYGREEESEHLLAAYKRVANGNTEMMLVSGYSGIGKTALVRVLYQPITELRGYFISGKFEQYQRNMPYSAIIRAFEELIEQLLTEPENQLMQWRETIQQALGVNGQVLLEIIPELELIIGKQPPIPNLQPTESENRLRLVFQNFIRVFTQPQHPLAIFIDDLQWADSASLNLIQLLFSSHDSKYMLLIGAYRDNEVDSGHIWMLTVEEIRKSGVNVNQLRLSALSLNQVNYLIAETLNLSTKQTLDLAQLVLTKAQGNAFFTREFIRSLYIENLVYFDHQQKQWQWDIEQIKARDITDGANGFKNSKLI
jgi:tRNA A-37 threonylcarbamoyl transferase component Bud32